MKANDIKGKGPVDELTVTIKEKGEPKEVRDGSLMLCECTAEDDSGEIILTLWNDDIEKYSEGDTLRVTKGWASEYQGKVSVSSGKFGQIEKVE